MGTVSRLLFLSTLETVRMTAYFESGAFFGEGAWHGEGNVLAADSPARRDVGQAIVHADMDWTVGCNPIFDAAGKEIVSHKAVTRSTDGRVLGIVKNRFRPLQNREIFNWFQPFLDSGSCQLETCGSLKGGTVVWVLARLEREALKIKDGDTIIPFLTLASSHDGSLATHVGFNPVRFVCWNTLSAGLAHKDSKLLRIRHTDGQHAALKQVRDVINLANQTFEATAEQCRQLANCKVSREDIREYVRVVFELSDDESISTRSANTLKKIVDLCVSGAGNTGETAWDAYNGVTQYLTHEAGRNAGTRLDSLWFGPNKARSDRALRLALSLAS